MTIPFGLLILSAYLLGAVPSAYLVAKWSRGIDLRQYGSGNVGLSNLLRSNFRWLIIPVILFDLGKGMIIIWVAQLLGLGYAQQVTIGVAAIMGHNWPVFLRFSGGRGILTTLGVIIILPSINGMVPWGAIISLIITAIGAFVVHNIPLGVIIAVAVVPLVSWGFTEPLPLTLGFLAIFLITIIRRLTVPRAAIAASVSQRELFINRLLFDRDIRDKTAWIHRLPPEASSTQQPLEQKKREGKG